MKKVLTSAVATIVALAGTLVGINTAQAALNVPKSAWPACSSARTTFCIDSVSVTTASGEVVPLTFVATGQTLAPADTSTVPTDTTTVVTPPTPTVATGGALVGRWTSLDWATKGLNFMGYDGLYVEAKTANEYVNHVFVNVLPTITNSSNAVNLATQLNNTKYAADLDGDVLISVTIKTGEIKPGVLVGVGTNFTGDYSVANSLSTIKFSGNPVTVPLAAKSADCSGETGVAVAKVRQLQAVLFINNDGQSAFGVDGVTGDMIVSSNGVCDLSTPVWNEADKAFSWTAAAPHFAPDGTTPNTGFYRAVIPAADAQLLWGLTNPKDAAQALTVQVTTTEGGTSAATSTIGVKNNKIIIEVTGFGYSRPKLKISLKKGWKPANTQFNKVTITCVRGSTVKKITAVKPICPKGYLKK